MPLLLRINRRPAHAAVLAALSLLALIGCEKPAVAWVDSTPVASAAPSPLAHPPLVPIDSTMRDATPESEFLRSSDLMREAGAITLLAQSLNAMPESRDSVPSGAMLPMMNMTAAPATSLGDGAMPADSARCARSLRVVPAPGRGLVAVWWSRRTNSRVQLVAAWRDSIVATHTLGAWRGPIVVDSLDQGPADARSAEHGTAGCARPAPSVAFDDQLGYVHVAYVLTGPEGPGVFYAHQMDPRSAFEAPQAIVYGERLGSARVAADGNVVAVGYEDPNSGARARIGLAVSRTAGHSFEERLLSSGTTSESRDPYVTVRGRAVVEGWSELSAGEPVFRMRRATVK